MSACDAAAAVRTRAAGCRRRSPAAPRARRRGPAAPHAAPGLDMQSVVVGTAAVAAAAAAIYMGTKARAARRAAGRLACAR